jgi:hypothetical protein
MRANNKQTHNKVERLKKMPPARAPPAQVRQTTPTPDVVAEQQVSSAESEIQPFVTAGEETQKPSQKKKNKTEGKPRRGLTTLEAVDLLPRRRQRKGPSTTSA